MVRYPIDGKAVSDMTPSMISRQLIFPRKESLFLTFVAQTKAKNS